MRKNYFTILTLFAFGSWMQAQDGQLDAGFGTGGMVTTSFANQSVDAGKGQAIQADGKILVSGYSSDPITGLNRFALARYTTNGTLDAGFGIGGTVITAPNPSFHCSGEAVAVQADGKIVVCGECNDTSTTNPLDGYFTIIRYNSNGSLDNTFGTGGIVTIQLPVYYPEVTAPDLVIQSDGNIVIAGQAEIVQNDSNMLFMRLTSTGALDNTFGTGGISVIHTPIQASVATAMHLLSDGRITVCGFADYNSFNRPILTQINPNGSVDTNFGSAGFIAPNYGFSSGFFGLSVQPDGKILGCGFSQNGGIIARLYDDGLADLTFGQNGILEINMNGNFSTLFEDILMQTDGKIVAAGWGDVGWALVRCDANGLLDPFFGNGGLVETIFPVNSPFTFASSVNLQSDGKIVVSGTTISINSNSPETFAVARYNNMGSSVNEFNSLAISVFPNPASEEIQIGMKNQQREVFIYDMTGKLMLQKKIYSGEENLNISQLAEGVYQISVLVNDEVSTTRLVIAR
jgi:uncharacterized delta-60 repeat protein